MQQSIVDVDWNPETAQWESIDPFIDEFSKAEHFADELPDQAFWGHLSE